MLVEQAFEVDAPIDCVWSFTRNRGAVGPCLPGCQGIEVTGDNACMSDVNVVGRLAKFGFGIMKKKAQSMGTEFAGAVKANREGE